MANIEKTVEIIFGATDEASEVFKNIESKVNTFSSNVTQPLSEAGDAALKTEAAIIGMGIAFLGVAVNEAAQFNTAINEIGTLFNATEEQAAALGEEVKTFGKDSVFSLSDTTDALYNMVSATGDVENAVGGLSDAQDLAVVTGTSLNTSVNAITTVLNSYNLGMEEAESVSEALFITVQGGKTNLDELSANIGKVAATASAADVPFDDLSAAIATLTAGGVSTAEAMTQIQNVIKELADPTDELKLAMGGLSLETDGLKPIMDALQETTGGNFAEMSKLFTSVESVKGALVLAGPGADLLGSSLEKLANKTGVVADNMKLMEDNLNLVTQNMKTNLDLAFIEIGNNLTTEWTSIVKGLSDIFKGVNVSLDAGSFDDVFAALNDFQIAIAEYLSGIAEVLPEALEGVDFSGFIDSFGEIGDAIGDIFGDLDLTDADDLKIAIQFVVDSFESLNLVVSGIVDAWGPALKVIVSSIATFNSTADSSKAMAGNILGASQVFETFKGLLPAFGTALKSVADILISIAVIKSFKSVVDLSGALSKLPLTSITAGLSKFLTALTGPAGLVVAAGLAGVALGSLAKDGIDAVIQSATGVKGATLGTWIYDVLHEDEGTTTENLKKLSSQILKMDGFDYQFTDKILDILNAETTGVSTADLLGKIENALGDLSDIDASRIADDVLNILNANLGQGSTEDALKAVLVAAENLGSGLPAAEKSVRDFDAEVAAVAESSIDMKEEIGKALDIIKDLPGVLDSSTTSLGKNVTAMGKLDEIMKSLGEDGGSAAEFEEATRDILEALSDSDGVYSDAEENTKEWIKATALQKQAAEDTAKPLSELQKEMGKMSEASRLAAEQAHDTEIKLLELATNKDIAAAQAIVDLEKQLNQLASNERIAAMKFTADIETSRIEAQAQQVKAAFESIAQSVIATTSEVSKLWEIAAGEHQWSGGEEFLDAAKRAEERAQQALDTQERLIDAQIELMLAQADALTQETVVRIESSGLEKDIEAFMFEILKRIQTKIIGDKSAFLLGAGI